VACHWGPKCRSAVALIAEPGAPQPNRTIFCCLGRYFTRNVFRAEYLLCDCFEQDVATYSLAAQLNTSWLN
jgi:hypothetical protein